MLAASYSGALKSHLTRPNYSKSINSWEAVLESGRRIEITFEYPAENFNPILDKVVDEAKLIDHMPIPNVRVHTSCLYLRVVWQL